MNYNPHASPALLTFLGELRAGADLRSSAVVSEMSMPDAERHASAEARGDYADVIAIEPDWSIIGGVLSFVRRTTVERGDE